jgi:hypothetical protein
MPFSENLENTLPVIENKQFTENSFSPTSGREYDIAETLPAIFQKWAHALGNLCATAC